MALTWIDVLFLAVLALSVLAGLVRGLVREALGLAVWVTALMAARALAQPVAERLAGWIDSFDARLVLGFVLVVLAVILLGGIVIRLLHAAIEWVGMGFLNRLAGAAFGLVRGTAVLLVATVLLTLTPLEALDAWQEAALRPTFEQLRGWALGQLEQWDPTLPPAPESIRDIPLPDFHRREAS